MIVPFFGGPIPPIYPHPKNASAFALRATADKSHFSTSPQGGGVKRLFDLLFASNGRVEVGLSLKAEYACGNSTHSRKAAVLSSKRQSA